jgi:hypothetical protein
MSMGRKGLALDQLASVGLLFVVLGVVLAIGAYINTQITTTAGWASTTLAYAAVGNATSGISSMAAWLPIIAIVIAAGVVISVLVGAFKFGGGV